MAAAAESSYVTIRFFRTILVAMEWLNYQHLLYFWTVVRSGSVLAAGEQLRLSPSTISEQLRTLEKALGEKLLRRSGRNLVPTETGVIVFRYADEIFATGRELMDTLKGRPTGRPMRVVIGIADVVPKTVVRQLIEPARHLEQAVYVVCREASTEQLLARLAIQELDVVLTDAPIGPTAKVRAYNHLLGETGTSFVAMPIIAGRCKGKFPRSLDGIPLLLPADNTAIRRDIEEWLRVENIRPARIGEFEDFALLRDFGEAGAGVFPAPTVLEKQLQRENGLVILGRVPTIRGRFFAISLERKLKHPAVVAISESARNMLFAS